jgi:putative sigma-54 modulation protein
MQIIFSGKHVDVTPALKQYAETKLGKLDRFFDGVQEVHIVESTLRNQHIVEVTLKANGTLIRAEEHSPDMYTSIDLVVDKLERQLSRYKDRFITRTRESLGGYKPQETIMPPEAPVEEEAGEFISQIVRTKRFAVKPMDPEEAAMEMEMIGHDFYVFRNSENDEVNVVYRRRDGNYGLIEPVVE